MTLQRKLRQLYQILLEQYGPQGWWPLSYSLTPQTKSVGESRYHPDIYSFPTNDWQKLEICLGAILTQNTNWKNAVKALNSLNFSRLTTLKKISKTKNSDLALAIRSAGYYNQKAKTIRNLTDLLNHHSFEELEKLPLRESVFAPAVLANRTI